MKNKILFICVLTAALFIWSCNEKSPVAPDFANQSETLDKRVHVPVGTVTPILSLSTDDSPEGIAIDKRGNMYISNTIGVDRHTNQILRVGPNGSHSIYATLPGAGHAAGLVTDKRGNVYVAFRTEDINTKGIYRIKRNGIMSRLRGSEEMVGPNALTFDAKGNLYCTDSKVGSVWKYGKDRTFSKWFEDPLLAPGQNSAGFMLPGANGIVFYPPNKLYVANTFQNSISRITIGHNGDATGIQQIAQHWKQLMNIDGIAVDVHENVYGVMVASTLGAFGPPPLAPLVMVNPKSGEITEIVVAADAANFNTPTSLTFATRRGPWDRKSVFVANAALRYGQPMEPWAAPGVVEVYVGKRGMPGK